MEATSSEAVARYSRPRDPSPVAVKADRTMPCGCPDANCALSFIKPAGIGKLQGLPLTLHVLRPREMSYMAAWGCGWFWSYQKGRRTSVLQCGECTVASSLAIGRRSFRPSVQAFNVHEHRRDGHFACVDRHKARSQETRRIGAWLSIQT